MLNTSFVHAADDAYFIESAYEKNMADIQQILTDVNIAETRINDMKMLGIYMESQDDYFVEATSNAVKSLGDKIIKIVEELKKFIRDAIQRIRKKHWQNKDLEKKMDAIQKDRPDIADKVKVAVSQGDLDFNTFKDINDFYKNIDNVLDEIEKGKVDPNSLKGKMEKIKKKLVDNKDAIQTISVAVGIVVSAAGIYLKYKSYKSSKLKDELNETERIGQVADKTIAKLEKVKKKLEEGAAKGDIKAVHYKAILAEAAASVQRETQLQITKREKLNEKLMRGFDSAYKNYISIFKKIKKSGTTITQDNIRDINITGAISRVDYEIKRLTRIRDNAKADLARTPIKPKGSK